MTPDAADRAAFLDFIARHQRFLLTTHINPDGDGLGSEVALALWLVARGKQALILNDAVVPPQFLFMTGEVAIESWESELAERRFTESDALVVLDTSNRQRIGRLAQTVERSLLPIAVVDHHATHTRGFGKINVIEPDAAATGEILFELFRESGHPITPAIAEALYVAVMTDTGSFRYSNTDPHVHRMAAELLAHGLDPQRLHALVHAHASAGRMRFFGEVLASLEMDSDGRLVVLTARPEQFQRHGLVGADTDGLVDMPRTIAGVEAVVLFSEAEPGKTKVSLRSTGRVSVDGLASRHGGGGHVHAAGILLRCGTDEARGRILPELRRLVEQTGTGATAAHP
ncbi:MAG: bifunctional oligoribonuclease/PAP phosphatase NrnA [Candidatus Eisenbacteria bacterium]